MQPMTRLRMHSAFVFWGGRGGSRDFFPLVPNVFPSYSHEVPKGLAKFPICSQQHLNFIPHKVAFPCTQTEKLGSTFDSILRLGVQRDVSTGECPTFQKIGDGSINLALPKEICPLSQYATVSYSF